MPLRNVRIQIVKSLIFMFGQSKLYFMFSRLTSLYLYFETHRTRVDFLLMYTFLFYFFNIILSGYYTLLLSIYLLCIKREPQFVVTHDDKILRSLYSTKILEQNCPSTKKIQKQHNIIYQLM